MVKIIMERKLWGKTYPEAYEEIVAHMAHYANCSVAKVKRNYPEFRREYYQALVLAAQQGLPIPIRVLCSLHRDQVDELIGHVPV